MADQCSLVINMSKKKKTLEFSQKYVLSAGLAMFLFALLSFLMSSLGKETLENLSIEMVRMFGNVAAIAFAGYNVQNSVRAVSYDKYIGKAQDFGTAFEDDNSDSNETPISLCKK